jgi:hypothetical protein
MRAPIILLTLGALAFATSASAYDANDPANCVGAEWDDAHPLAVAKVTARERVKFRQEPL